ncbi:unnamed protein product, partial [Laminaria digitata]
MLLVLVVLLLTKEALDVFHYNAFNLQETSLLYIATRIPDGGCTTVYRNGDFVFSLISPHLPSTTLI